MNRGVLTSAVYLATITVALVLRLTGVLNFAWFWFTLWLVGAATVMATLGANRDLREVNAILVERMRADAGPPATPVNVRVRYPDGSEQPLELVYRGLRDDGIHVWTATGVVSLVEGAKLVADELPPHTAIELVVGE